jgi:transcriptional regulator with XRE-family HTH domain
MTIPVGSLGSIEMPRQQSARPREFVANSVVKEMRGALSQIQIAQAAGISQAFLSELETSHKRLTVATAQKLAPALGTTPAQLLLDEQLATLNRVAQQGNMDPQTLLEEAERLDEILPNGEISEAIFAALMAIVCERPKLLT